jgi:hypothetical protein
LRFEKVCQRLISKEQNAFIWSRYILESVVIAHEIMHSIYKSKEPEVIIKLDYEKAYDKVNLDFLMEILKTKGFSEKWIDWIGKVTKGGLVSVLVNGVESKTFKTDKGLRQGGSLVPPVVQSGCRCPNQDVEKGCRESSGCWSAGAV